MEDLQDNILRVLDTTASGYISQQDAWNTLIELDLIDDSMDKEYFLQAYLKIVKNYNEIDLEIVDTVYYLKKTNCEPKQCEVSIYLPVEKLINFIVENKLIPFSTVIGSNGDTVMHYIVLCKNKAGIEDAKIGDVLIKNTTGKTPLDYISTNEKEILFEIIEKLHYTNKDLETNLIKINDKLQHNIKCVEYISKKFESPFKYYIISFIFGIMVKFLFDKFFY